MTTKIGIRELSRNFVALQDYDYIEIEDKKTNEIRGLLVSANLAQKVKGFLDKEMKKVKQKEFDEFMQVAGKGKVDEKFNNLSSKEIKEEILKEKYAN